jgi:EAL and modified HD-GYP domain-containing signal transduction protein
MDSEGQLAEIFIGRQPILDREQVTIGYELLFRNSHDNEAHLVDQRSATADVVCKAFAELGLAAALGTQRAFINVDIDFLFDDAIEFLPGTMVVFEVKLDQPASAETVARCRQLRDLGYEFSVAGMTESPDALCPMLDLAAFVRIDVDGMSADALKSVVARLKSPTRRLIASRVEANGTMKLCREAGFDYFQGFYFAKPVIIEGRKLDASTQGLIRIINLLSSDADVIELERAFKSEPALTVNLLRLTNSVGAGLAVKISSVRHAITVLGRKQLQRWLSLLMFAGTGNNAGIAGNPLMQWAALRGSFMELLAGRCYPAKKEMRDKAFITGLMSLMPAALGLPMETILEQIGLPQDLGVALLRHEGEIGMLLELTERYDNDDMDGTVAIFRHVGGKLTLQSLALCLTEAIAWVQQIGVEAD